MKNCITIGVVHKWRQGLKGRGLWFCDDTTKALVIIGVSIGEEVQKLSKITALFIPVFHSSNIPNREYFIDKGLCRLYILLEVAKW